MAVVQGGFGKKSTIYMGDRGYVAMFPPVLSYAAGEAAAVEGREGHLHRRAQVGR